MPRAVERLGPANPPGPPPVFKRRVDDDDDETRLTPLRTG